MKLRNIILGIAIVLFVTIELSANTNPVVTNVAFTYSGTTVTITYDLKDAEQTTVNVRMLVSENSGATWTENTSEASGDIGDLTDITTTETAQTITWEYSGSNQATMKIKIIANDETADGSPCAGVEKVYYEGGPHNDNDGNGDYYSTIQIAGQCWLKENLNIGTQVNNPGAGNHQFNNSIKEKYCYDNTASYCVTDGGLYEWNEAMQYVTTEGAQGICPNGWHIPTRAEALTLKSTVESSSNALKSVGQGSSGGAGTNTSGFSALLSGERKYNGDGFRYFGSYFEFWTSTKYPDPNPDHYYYYYIRLYYLNDGVSDNGYSQNTAGYSIRCLKD